MECYITILQGKALSKYVPGTNYLSSNITARVMYPCYTYVFYIICSILLYIMGHVLFIVC